MAQRTSVLVILAFAAIAVGLAIVTVSRVRQTARFMQCQNNLRQIGLSIQNFKDSHRYYPSGAMQQPGIEHGKRQSWQIELLPYIECWADPKTYTLAWDDPKMDGYLHTSIECLCCPENPHRYDEAGRGLAHYIGIAGLGENAATIPLSDRNAGFFGYDRKLTPADITDGAATTIAVIESTSNNGPWIMEGPSTVRGLVPEQQPYIGVGGQFFGLHVNEATPFAISPPRMANVVFADGHVRSIRPDISPKLLEALATVAGDERDVPAEIGE